MGPIYLQWGLFDWAFVWDDEGSGAFFDVSVYEATSSSTNDHQIALRGFGAGHPFSELRSERSSSRRAV